jgi:hypothetical protein
VSSSPDSHLSTVPSAGRRAIPSGCPNRPSIIRPDDVDFRPNTSLYSIMLQILSKFIYGKIDETVRTRFSLRQESQFKFNHPHSSLPSSGRVCILYGNCGFDFNRPDAYLSWSERAHNKYGNFVLKINRPDGHPPWSGRAKALYGNYLQRTCDRPDDSVSPSGRSSQTGKIFSENLKNSGHTVVRPDGSGSLFGRRPYILLQSPL